MQSATKRLTRRFAVEASAMEVNVTVGVVCKLPSGFVVYTRYLRKASSQAPAHDSWALHGGGAATAMESFGDVSRDVAELGASPVALLYSAQ